MLYIKPRWDVGAGLGVGWGERVFFSFYATEAYVN